MQTKQNIQKRKKYKTMTRTKQSKNDKKYEKIKTKTKTNEQKTKTNEQKTKTNGQKQNKNKEKNGYMTFWIKCDNVDTLYLVKHNLNSGLPLS